MFFHCYVWTIIVSIPLLVFDSFDLYEFAYLLIGHFAIDKLKGWVDPNSDWIDEDGRNININKWTYMDQGLHCLQLLVVGLI